MYKEDDKNIKILGHKLKSCGVDGEDNNLRLKMKENVRNWETLSPVTEV